MTFNNHPAVHFKLKKEIDITSIPNPNFTIERRYHSAGKLIIDNIQCKVMGMPKKYPNPNPRNETRSKISLQDKHAQNQNPRQSTEPEDQIVRINGINSSSDVTKVKKWLQLYGELINDITEESHYDSDPDSEKVGNGIYTVKMKIKKPIPNFLPAMGLKIRIYYRGCMLLCPNCYRVHPRRQCHNAKLTWIGYVLLRTQ